MESANAPEIEDPGPCPFLNQWYDCKFAIQGIETNWSANTLGMDFVVDLCKRHAKTEQDILPLIRFMFDIADQQRKEWFVKHRAYTRQEMMKKGLNPAIYGY